MLLESPVLLEEELQSVIASSGIASTTFSLHYATGSPDAMKEALHKLCTDVEAAVKGGCEIVVLSDRLQEGEEVGFIHHCHCLLSFLGCFRARKRLAVMGLPAAVPQCLQPCHKRELESCMHQSR